MLPSEVAVLFYANLSRCPFLGQVVALDLMLCTGFNLEHDVLFLCYMFIQRPMTHQKIEWSNEHVETVYQCIITESFSMPCFQSLVGLDIWEDFEVLLFHGNPNGNFIALILHGYLLPKLYLDICTQICLDLIEESRATKYIIWWSSQQGLAWWHQVLHPLFNLPQDTE